MIRKSTLKRTKALKRGGYIARTKTPRRVKMIRKVNAKRKAKNRARAYGPAARVEWVKSLACVAAGKDGFGCHGVIENAHTTTGGTGRKSDARFIVPCCQKHHRALHAWGAQKFQLFFGVSLAEQAELTENAWRQIAGSGGERETSE